MVRQFSGGVCLNAAVLARVCVTPGIKRASWMKCINTLAVDSVSLQLIPTLDQRSCNIKHRVCGIFISNKIMSTTNI